ncbi:MAG: VapB-type antitoxin [Candidatus Micrarchaeaceae archaeon]
MYTNNVIMETEVISVRVKKGTKEHFQKAKIDINEAVRLYLEELERKQEARQTIERLKKIIEERVKPSKPGFAVKTIRWDREHAH